MVRFNYQNVLLTDMGFSTFGFSPETQQPLLSIHGIQDKEKILEGFEVIKKYMKPVTVEDSQHGQETGIRIAFHGIEENTASIAYVKKNGSVVLYRSKV
jgi:hypothetical protein